MNKQEKAYDILERYQLIDKLEKIGKTSVIGSLKMGLMVSNDIDIDVDNVSMSIEQLYEFTRYVLKEFHPTWYEAKEEINDVEEKVWFHGFEAIIDGELWNFDIWFLNRETINKAERYCEQIIEQVSANKEAKERIILLKKVLCDDNQKIFVAEIEHLVVGYVHATKYDLLYANSMVNIMGLAVLEEYRYNGIATKLMDSVEEWAKNIGVDAIRPTSGKEREEAHKFYSRVGFEREKEQINFVRRLESTGEKYEP